MPPHNIDKSAFRKGEYSGYTGYGLYEIARSRVGGWRARLRESDRRSEYYANGLLPSEFEGRTLDEVSHELDAIRRGIEESGVSFALERATLGNPHKRRSNPAKRRPNTSNGDGTRTVILTKEKSNKSAISTAEWANQRVLPHIEEMLDLAKVYAAAAQERAVTTLAANDDPSNARLVAQAQRAHDAYIRARDNLQYALRVFPLI